MNQARASGSIEIECASAAEARAVAAALEPDNGGYVTATISGATIHFKVADGALGTMVRTVDDLLAAVTAALDASRTE